MRGLLAGGARAVPAAPSLRVGLARGPRAWRLAAVLLALLAATALNGAIAVESPAGPLADLTHFKHWARLVTVDGMHAAYSGDYPETYAIYPPVTLVTFRLAGVAYQRLVDPTFDLDRALASHTLAVLLRLVALGFHLLVGLAVLAVARQAVSFGAAYAAMLAYLFNPGAVFDVAQWGQPDPVFGLFVLLAVAAVAVAGDERAALPRPWSLITRRATVLGPAAAGLAIALAALAKPQAWVYLPLVAALVWRRGGPVGLLAAGVAGAVGALLVALPFIVHGTLRELLGLPAAISSVMPVVTANAHNLWWAYSGGAARWYLDQDPFVGPLSYRLVAVGIVGACAGLALLRAVREPTLGVAFAAAAYTAFGFFMGMTQIHENHMYAVFPLLAVAAAVDRRLWPIYGVLALTWCANMLLHDFDLAEQVVAPLLPWSLEDAQRANGLIDVAVFAAWTAWLLAATARAWLAPPAPRAAARATSEV